VPTMNPNGTIAHEPRLLGCDDTSLALYVEATYPALLELLGEPDTANDDGPMWVVRVYNGAGTAAERATVYRDDVAARAQGGTPLLWHVGSHRDGRWAAQRLAAAVGVPEQLEVWDAPGVRILTPADTN